MRAHRSRSAVPRAVERCALAAFILVCGACGSTAPERSPAPTEAAPGDAPSVASESPPGAKALVTPLPNRAAPGSAPLSRADAVGEAQPEPDPPRLADVHLTDELPPDVKKALAYDPADPLGDLESADVLDRHAGPVAVAGPVPANGCTAAGSPVRVWPRAGPAAIASLGSDFLVAGYDAREGREQLYVVHVPGTGQPRPIATLPIAVPQLRERHAAPGIAAGDAAQATVAVTDGAGTLHVATVRVSGGARTGLVPVAQGVDPRFAPAVAHTLDRTLVAWTEGSTPMRTVLARLDQDGAVLGKHDVTLTSMGAAAPTFVAGVAPPRLLVVDARQGVSPVVEIDVDVDATPRPGKVALVVSSLASPPELAAASSGATSWLAYTALGSAATSAVGIVRLAPPGGGPEALVPGAAYGPLHVAAAAGERAVVFAADAPTRAGKDAPRQIAVHVVGNDGRGPAYRIDAPGGASRATIARTSSGLVGVAYRTDLGIYLARLRCDGT